MVNKHMKRYSSSLVIQKMQIKTTIIYYYIPIRMANIKIMIPPNAGDEMC